MQKKTLAIISIIVITGLVAACKKNPAAPTPPPGNVQHAITDTFYWRALLDTTWAYHGDNNKSECHSNNGAGLCSSFLYDATFTFSDSANPHPHDSIIMSWVGQTFVTRYDTIPHPYTFTFTYPDSTGIDPPSSANAMNLGARLTITSIVPNGFSSVTIPDSPGHMYKLYKVKGTFNVDLAKHYGDSSVIHLTQGDFSTSVMESTQP